MRIFSKNNPAKLHPDPISNDGAFFGEVAQQEGDNKNNKMSSDMRSVPGPKIVKL